MNVFVTLPPSPQDLEYLAWVQVAELEQLWSKCTKQNATTHWSKDKGQ